MIICSEEKCTACGSCMNKCPKKCISLKINEFETPVAFVNSQECISCGICQSVCPVYNPLKLNKPDTCYAAW